MTLTDGERTWFRAEIERLDPLGKVVSIEDAGGVTKVRYSEKIRSDETLLRAADPEELVRALTICLLCSDEYGYTPERLYIEQTHSIGRPSASVAQIDLLIYFAEEDGSETVFAMWEMKAPDAYKPSSDPLIEKQLFDTAPLVQPSLLVYSTVKPGTSAIECITVDYTAHKTFERWSDAGRPAS